MNNSIKQTWTNDEITSAVPILPSNNLKETAEMFEKIGAQFVSVMEEHDYAVIRLGGAELHFFTSDDRKLAEWSSCRIIVNSIEQLYATCTKLGIVHPNGKLQEKPWGFTEFAILDKTGVCYTFSQSL